MTPRAPKPPRWPTIVVDTREPEATAWRPWLSERGKQIYLPTVRAKLDAGDYSVEGLEHEIMIERKADDLVSTLILGWERFERELLRAQKHRFRAVITECSRLDILAHRYVSRAPPLAVLARADLLFTRYGVPVIWAGSRTEAERLMAWTLVDLWEQAQRAEADADAESAKPTPLPEVAHPPCSSCKAGAPCLAHDPIVNEWVD